MTPPYPPLRARRTHDPSDDGPATWILAGTRRTRRAVVAAGTTVALSLLGMAGSAASAETAPPPPKALTTTASGIPQYDHVVVLMEENKFYDDIVGSKDAPYINSLAKQGASFSDFHGTTHPSQGNYVALYSGSTHGVADDDCPHDFSADNLGHQLIGSGHSFTGYSEDLPSAGSKDCGDDGDSGYARKHNGWVDFASTPASSNLGFDRFPSDYSKLPTVSFVTPNLDNDMHDGSVKQGDSWLKKNLDGYVQWARTHNSALMLTWDEDDGDDSDNQIATMIVGDHVQQGAKSKAHYNHYSLLRTLEDMYALSPLGKAASAKPVTDIWDTSVAPPKGYGAAPAPAPAGPPASAPAGRAAGSAADLTDPRKKDIAMELVSSAENSSLDWKAQYTYVEDIGDGRGYTGGIVGFCSGTGDMLDLVQLYTQREPGNPLAAYLPALRTVNGSDSHAGLGSGFVSAWHTAASDPAFQQAQNDERDRVYFTPSVDRAKQDGLHALGQFSYYDAMVMHGPGMDPVSFGGIRATAMKHARTPAQGGDETTYLHAFLDARKAAMLTEAAHDDTSRVDTEQRVFLAAGNLDLNPPLSWKTYGDPYTIAQ